jgi:hypothetical protein
MSFIDVSAHDSLLMNDSDICLGELKYSASSIILTLKSKVIFFENESEEIETKWEIRDNCARNLST